MIVHCQTQDILYIFKYFSYMDCTSIVYYLFIDRINIVLIRTFVHVHSIHNTNSTDSSYIYIYFIHRLHIYSVFICNIDRYILNLYILHVQRTFFVVYTLCKTQYKIYWLCIHKYIFHRYILHMYCVYIVHRSNIRCICTTICIDGKFIVQIMFNISILNIHYTIYT